MALRRDGIPSRRSGSAAGGVHGLRRRGEGLRQEEAQDDEHGRISKQGVEKRTRVIRVFPNKEALPRLASALLVELDDKWLSETKAYI